ncbi:MAG: serine hydrolase [Bacteroidetes bacterium]|nr:serine hydrolase [Bacteroidota bacterium]
MKSITILTIFKTIALIIGTMLHMLSTVAQTRSEKLDELFCYYNENGMFNGAVMAAENGKIVYNKAFGFSDFENKTPFDSIAVFAIGSITKPFTATAIMMLKEKGLLSYDDKLSKYFPEFPAQASTITIRNLLTHTSGIPDFRGNKFKVFKQPMITNKMALDTLINNFHLEFQPGIKYRYSNSNYLFLALIIEKISGMSYKKFIDDKIFKPAGMNKTYIADEYSDASPNRVNAYVYYWDKTDYDLQDRASGHGNIYSTVYDLFLFDQALYSNKLLKQETLNEAYNFSLYLDSKNSYRYGLGWRIEGETEGRGIVAHRGAIGAFRGLLWRDINNKNTLIILTNNWWLSEIPEILQGAQSIMEGKDYKLAKVSIQALFLDNWYMYGFDAALNKMRKVVTEAPDHYNYSEDLLNNLAYYFVYSRSEPSFAKSILEFSLEVYPESAVLWDSLGEMNSILNNIQTAISCYEKSLELDPENANAQKMLDKLRK